MSDFKNINEKIDFFDYLFGFFIDQFKNLEETKSAFDDSVEESEATSNRAIEKYQQKWMISIIKAVVKSNFAIPFTFFMIRQSYDHQNMTNLEVTLECLSEKQVKEQSVDITMQ